MNSNPESRIDFNMRCSTVDNSSSGSSDIHTSLPDPVTEPVHTNTQDKRSCWVCFATDDDDNIDHCWVQPCSCRGTTKWVHQSCLQRWVDEKQRGNPLNKVACPQCNREYIIVFPNMGVIVSLLDTIDVVIYKVCPFLAAGIVVGSVYWSAVTYGAITIMQVVGHEEGLLLMSQAHSLVLIVGLPAIPVMLITAKVVRWEETLFLFLRRYSAKIPIIKHILPSFVYTEEVEPHPPGYAPSLVDTICATRVLCSSLLLPTIATLVGRLFFDSVPSRLQRTLLGGIAFVTIKGIFKLYHRQKKCVQRRQRKILDFIDEGPTNLRSNNVNAESAPSTPNSTWSNSSSASSPF